MNADKKADQSISIKNKKSGHSLTSKGSDYEINTSLRDLQEKVDNSGLNRSMRDVKPTPENSLHKSEGYRLNFFDLIPNNLFSPSPIHDKVSEKEQSLHQDDDEVNIVQDINDFVNLNIFADEITGQNRSPSRLVINDNQLNPNTSMNNNPQGDNSVHIEDNQNENNGIDENNAPGNPEANNIVDVPNNIQPQNIVNTLNRGIKQKMKEHMIFYLIMTVLYSLGCLTFQGFIGFHLPLIFVVAILCIEFIKEYKRKQPASLTIRQKRIRHCTLIELGFLVFFLFGAALRLEKVELGLFGFTIPGFLNIVLFLFGTDPIGTPSIFGQKTKTFLRRLYLWIQILLLAVMSNDEMSSWRAAFGLSYYLLFGFLFYSVLVFIIFLSAVFGWRRQESPYKVNLIGFGWYFLVSLYSWFWFSILMELINFLDDEDGANSLTASLIQAIAHSLFLVLYVIIFRNQLSQFMRYEVNEMGSRRNSAQQQNNRVERTIKFQVSQDDIPYLVIISPTFYAHIKDTFHMNKNNLLQWIKQIKAEKAKKNLKTAGSQDTKPTAKFNFTRELLDPIRLDGNPNVKRTNPDGQEERIYPFSMITLQNHQFGSFNCDNSKVFYSLNDLSIYENIKKPFENAHGPLSENEQDKLCYICIERPQNAVFMKCGHGGVCYECAIESWRKTDKCLICRQVVEKIVKVDIIDSLKVSKIIHSTRKIVEDKVINPR